MKITRKHSDFKFVMAERRKNHLVLKPNYPATKFIKENFKFQISGLSMLELIEFWYDYAKQKYDEKPKLCCFIVYIKTGYIHKDIGEDVETRFDTFNHESDRPLPKGKRKKLIGLMKDDKKVEKSLY